MTADRPKINSKGNAVITINNTTPNKAFRRDPMISLCSQTSTRPHDGPFTENVY
jgi:hypothetical protein